ncbi:MAG: hypothetical protein FJ405_02590 [Verrucomicrobia bacterium]|nr:hypothetical protein [Verrucomicrobiota bacterium]
MSKAFTRESDDAPERPEFRRAPDLLPTEVNDYITQDGYESLQAELARISAEKGPDLSAGSSGLERPRSTVKADQRAKEIRDILMRVTVAPVAELTDKRVRFGSRVVVHDPEFGEMDYRIVGVREADVDRGWISWISPLAKALLGVEEGQVIECRLPSGIKRLQLMRVDQRSGPMQSGS